MTTLKEWTDRNAKRPLAAALLGILGLQLSYLGFLAYLQYTAQAQRVDRIVETAALGIDQENRPLIESTLTNALRYLDADSVALCRDGQTYILTPRTATDPCRSPSSSLQTWTITRTAPGRQGYQFLFVLDRFAPLRPLTGVLVTFGFAIPIFIFILVRTQRRFEEEILDPLCERLNDDRRLDIRELEELRLKITRLAALSRQQAVSEALVSLASQVAHDIRSPLAVLESAATEVSNLPEDQRVMIRRAASHIRDIASGLLSRYGGSHRPAGTPETPAAATSLSSEMLASLLASIVSEKRVQYRDRAALLLETSLDEHSYALFARVDATELRRAVSNLINNAVEALPEGSGRVDVDLATRNGQALIVVRDNGRGISPEVLAKLGSRGATYGKAGGSGLGLAHAKSCAQAWGGRLELDSTVARGTTVTLALPLAPAPRWFVPQIAPAADGTVVVLDDDSSIHQVWENRLAPARRAGERFELVHAFNPEDLRRWAANNHDAARAALFLLDYQLMAYSETGLDLAQELGIAQNAILVTSAHDDPRVVERCEGLGMGLLPKSLATLVPVRIRKSGSTTPELLDAVLLDDDELVQKLWKGAAADRGKRLRVFNRASELLAALDEIDKRSAIYLDSRLEDGTRGELLARELHAQGFRTLYLATGQSSALFADMPWITKVVGKSAPWAVPASAATSTRRS